MEFIRKAVAKYLRELADKFDAGNTNISEEQSIQLLSLLANEELSKDQACSFLNIQRSKFDKLVREGKLPKGRKVRGFKELRWNKKDLINIRGNVFNP